MAVLGDRGDEAPGEGRGVGRCALGDHAGQRSEGRLGLLRARGGAGDVAADQQVDALAGRGDRLAVTEGLVDEVQGVALAAQGADALGAARHEDGVIEDRGGGQKGLVGLEGLAGRGLDRAEPGRDELDGGAGFGERVLDLVDLIAVDAVGDEEGDLAGLDAVLGVVEADDHAQLRRLGGAVGGALDAREAGGAELGPALLQPLARGCEVVAGAVDGHADAVGDAVREALVDVQEDVDHALADVLGLDLAELEAEGVDDVLLLRVGHAAPEHRRLAEVVVEALAALAHLVAADGRGVGDEAGAAVLHGAAAAARVGLIVHRPDIDGVALVAVALGVVDRAGRAIDGDLVEVGAAEARELGVEVREQAALQQRVLREVDARHDVGGAERDLLGLGEEVVGVAVEHQLADALHRHEALGPELGRVERVEVEAALVGLLDDLEAELVLGEVALVDVLPQVAAVVVGVLAHDLLGLVPHEAVHAEQRLPVELDEHGLAGVVDEAEGVDAEALHHAIAARQGAVRHDPHQHVGRLGGEPGEVPEVIVGRAGLRHVVVRLGLDRVHEVRELDRVLDEEDGDVVADQVPDAVLGVELDGEAADVAGRVGRATRADDGREAHEHRRLEGGVVEQLGLAQVRERLIDLEVPVRRGAAGMHGALRDALVVEVGDLLAEDEVLEQGRSARAGLE